MPSDLLRDALVEFNKTGKIQVSDPLQSIQIRSQRVKEVSKEDEQFRPLTKTHPEFYPTPKVVKVPFSGHFMIR